MVEIACFAYNQQLPNNYNEGNISGLDAVFQKLAADSIEAVVSVGAEAAFSNDSVTTAPGSAIGTSIAETTATPLSDVGVMVNLLNRRIRTEDLPAPDALPPVINKNSSRTLAFNKNRMHDEVLTPLGLGVPSQLILSTEDISTFISRHKSGNYVVKPNQGINGKRVQHVLSGEVEAVFANNDEWFTKKSEQRLLQPDYDFTVPLPSSIRPYDAASRAGFERWSGAVVPKEVRAYGFYSPAGVEIFPVGRAIHKTHEDAKPDNWFFLDPDSVPAKIYGDTEAVITKAAEVSGATAMLMTVDFGYGTDGTQDSDWNIFDVNGRMPYMIGYDKHAGVADILRTHFADQLKHTIAA